MFVAICVRPAFLSRTLGRVSPPPLPPPPPALQAGTFGRAFALRFAPLTFVVAVTCAVLAGLLVFGGPG